MKKLFAVLLTMLLTATPAFTLNLTKEGPSNATEVAETLCINVEDFIKRQSVNINILYKLPDQYLAELEKTINGNLNAKGAPSVQISGFYVALLTNGEYGTMYHNAVGCIYPNSLISIPAESYFRLLEVHLPVLKKLEVVNG